MLILALYPNLFNVSFGIKNGEFGFQVDKCHLGWVKLKVSERGESKNE